MVKICAEQYSDENNKYEDYFQSFPFPLSSFQKYAIEAIVEGHHILITAHTGSGKTLPAEFAIDFFTKQKKKVIYTSPIKALSNQKYYEFKQKFPHISFGILTGDIKANPNADVLIMTTEILMNQLYYNQHSSSTSTPASTSFCSTSFQMDFNEELACVIFDEIHFINDAERGRVWEETIMSLPPHIQMVMLSATLDSPETFAQWCESQKQTKTVYLASTEHRIVPLVHHSFVTCTQGFIKSLKNKELEAQVTSLSDTIHLLQDSKGSFNGTNYMKVTKLLELQRNKGDGKHRQHVLNRVCKKMVEDNMLPAICFVLSRKQLEQYANEVTFPLLEDDSKVPYIVQRECEQIIRKLPNYEEYLHLPEYQSMIQLLEKGIAIHHAGVMPILREMVEMLFAKGYIKLLFATETFAVGINMPTKTVLFTDIYKYDGNHVRPLYSHEYTQMAGRAGRRGIDTIGHVIHLSNLFREIDEVTLKKMMKGTPQKLISKFKISYSLLLQLISNGTTNKSDLTHYVSQSMLQKVIENESATCSFKMNAMEITEPVFLHPIEKLMEFHQFTNKRKTAVNKARREIDKCLNQLKDECKGIENEMSSFEQYLKTQKERDQLEIEKTNIDHFFDWSVHQVLHLLLQGGFIAEESDNYFLTHKGTIASQIREVNCVAFADLILKGSFCSCSPSEIAAVLSCFTNISVSEDKRNHRCITTNAIVEQLITRIQTMYLSQQDQENRYQVDTGIDYYMQFDAIDYVLEWCECEDEQSCKAVLQKMKEEKDIFLGEFVKALLKITNIVNEMIKVAETIGDVELLSKLNAIPSLLLKFVATNQSLYLLSYTDRKEK